MYIHYQEKVEGRIAKRLVRFVEKLETHYEQGPPITDDQQLQEFMGLVKASRFIRTIHSKLLEPKSPDITKLVLSMRLIHRAVREVLKAPESLIKWSYYASGMYVSVWLFSEIFNRKVDTVPIPGVASNATVPVNFE
jgi:hypothetical protein